MFPSTTPNGTFPAPPSAPPQPPEIVSSTSSLYPDDPALLHGIHAIKTSANEKTRPQTQPSSSLHPLLTWSTGLCDCCRDPSSCCLTCCCPCIAFGRIAEIADRGSTSCGVSGGLYMMILLMTGCPCLYSCFYRSKLRGQYFLEEKPCCDCCVHCCFEPCALCQEYRQLKKLGFDMEIGWHGNMERKKRGVISVPPSEKIDMNR